MKTIDRHIQAQNIEQLRRRAQSALQIVEQFLDDLGEGQVQAVYLIGSVAEGTATESSDVDFLMVGPGLDEAEAERVEQAEAGMLFSQYERVLGIDHGPGDVDIILSSSGPGPEQKAILLWGSV